MPRRKIAIVNGDKLMCELVNLYLQPDFAIVEAAGEVEALELLRTAQPNLILLDATMPGLDGFDTLRQIRDQSAVPIVLLTATGNTPDRMKGLRMGADDCMPKPFNGHELAARIEAVLRRS